MSLILSIYLRKKVMFFIFLGERMRKQENDEIVVSVL